MKIGMFSRGVLLVIAMLVVVAQRSYAAVLIQHSGASNPTTEGFTFISGGTFTVGPLTPDDGTGVNAWQIQSTGTTPFNSYAAYEHDWTVSENNLLNNNARAIRVRLRVVDSSDRVDPGMIGELSFGGKSYYMGFGSNASGDPIIGLGAAFGSYPLLQQYTVTGAAGQYVEYDLVNTSAASSVFRLFVNGTDTGIDYSGGTYAGTARAVMGDGSAGTGDFGNANWNLFEVEYFTPEPSVAALLLCGLGVVYRRRRI